MCDIILNKMVQESLTVNKRTEERRQKHQVLCGFTAEVRDSFGSFIKTDFRLLLVIVYSIPKPASVTERKTEAQLPFTTKANLMRQMLV